jgi:hypothetical protein
VQGLKWVTPIDGELFKLFPKEVDKSWAAWAGSLADPGFECDGEFYKQAEVPGEVNGLRADLRRHYVQLLSDCTRQGGLHSICHGDPRLDNFYYKEDGSVGLLDWQLMGVACIATDISWVLCFHDLPSRFPSDVERLVADYFSQLQSLGGAPGKTLADLKEQVALAHLYSLGKAVIGTGGLANTDAHAKQIMHLLVSCCSPFFQSPSRVRWRPAHFRAGHSCSCSHDRDAKTRDHTDTLTWFARVYLPFVPRPRAATACRTLAC